MDSRPDPTSSPPRLTVAVPLFFAIHLKLGTLSFTHSKTSTSNALQLCSIQQGVVLSSSGTWMPCGRPCVKCFRFHRSRGGIAGRTCV